MLIRDTGRSALCFFKMIWTDRNSNSPCVSPAKLQVHTDLGSNEIICVALKETSFGDGVDLYNCSGWWIRSGNGWGIIPIFVKPINCLPLIILPYRLIPFFLPSPTNNPRCKPFTNLRIINTPWAHSFNTRTFNKSTRKNNGSNQF